MGLWNLPYKIFCRNKAEYAEPPESKLYVIAPARTYGLGESAANSTGLLAAHRFSPLAAGVSVKLRYSFRAVAGN